MILKHQSSKASLASGSEIVEQIPPGSLTPTKKYSKGRLLGKGGFAKCYEFTSLQSSRKYAAKVIQKASLNQSKAKEKLSSQIKIHRSLKHQNIVAFEHCFEDSENVYILLQMCPNQTLNQLLKRRKRLTEIEVQYYLYQIAQAVSYIHSEKVIHRDLKLGNLFLSEKLEIKIGDFGLATKLTFDGQLKKTMCGTPNYIAPQILINKQGHSYEVDTWSLGVIAYALLVGKPPFETHDVKLTYSKIKACNYSFPEALQISQRARQFVSKLLHLDPSKRMTIEQALHDNFFTLNQMPASLPISTLACPPNANFLRQYQRQQRTSTQLFQNSAKKKGFESHHQAFTSEKGQKTNSKLNSNKLQTDKANSKVNSMEKGLTMNASKKFGSAQKALSSVALLSLKKTQFPEKPNSPFIWITYFEQNPKFGMCYLLNSNAVGMKFNDSTSLILNSHLTKMTYLELDGKLEPKQQLTFGTTEVPQNLMKKMRLISHYHKALRERKNEDESALSNQLRIQKERLKLRQTPQDAMKTYVKRYVREQDATVFWMNNGDTHTAFTDGSRLVITRVEGIYINRYYEKRQFIVADFRKESDELKRRMLYVIGIVEKVKVRRMEKRSLDLEDQRNPQKQNGPIMLPTMSKCPSGHNLIGRNSGLRNSEDLLKVCLSMNKLLAFKRISTEIKEE